MMRGGFGSGCICSVCETPIGSQQLEAEIQDQGKWYHLHLQCMAAWESLIALGNGSAPAPILQPVADGGYSEVGELLSERRPK
jgi:hypothetical protein